MYLTAVFRVIKLKAEKITKLNYKKVKGCFSVAHFSLTESDLWHCVFFGILFLFLCYVNTVSTCLRPVWGYMKYIKVGQNLLNMYFIFRTDKFSCWFASNSAETKWSKLYYQLYFIAVCAYFMSTVVSFLSIFYVFINFMRNIWEKADICCKWNITENSLKEQHLGKYFFSGQQSQELETKIEDLWQSSK